jgi:hypothetical protein
MHDKNILGTKELNRIWSNVTQQKQIHATDNTISTQSNNQDQNIVKLTSS